MELIDLVKNAKESTYKLQSLNTEIKNYALSEIAKNIEKRKNEIITIDNLNKKNDCFIRYREILHGFRNA